MNFALTFIISYLIGCIPSALIVSKFFAGKNPGDDGSHSYGAMNSYEITGKKYIGILVFILDCAKGALATTIAYNIIFPKSIYIVIAAISVVVGHCFNVFLKFRGGRGLATSLGAVLTFNPIIAVIWGFVWFLFWRIIKKDVHFANTWATLITPLVVYGAPGYVFFYANYNYYVTYYDYRIFAIILCTIIFGALLRK
ncbi:MAG: glycerol-3-phosphate acyltransferase [Ignavibacteria bacterium]|jgi:glycerol-3-phosphate acyltransferase PlsY|nr:glycerol-3-phosphate acyltransferase [Ignavibacteria bacterium]